MNKVEMECVVGLEVHIQLNTQSKAFTSDSNSFTTDPNVNISPLTLALPGTLPRANKSHIAKALKLGLSLNCAINSITSFDRKNYNYPDLPKGYQITQDRLPIAVGGEFSFYSEGLSRTIRIHHIHMEEDAGKSVHDLSKTATYLDFNRAGTPLVEFVTEPDFRSGQEVYDFIEALQLWVQYLEISDGNMEEGSLRCDCNVSVRRVGDVAYGNRCEIKNVNSKKFAKQAITFEFGRQVEVINAGGTIYQSTLLFDSNSGETRLMRSKESANDYRYFPDPDLPPISLDESMIEKVKKEIDWTPITMSKYFSNTYHLDDSQISVIAAQKEVAKSFIQMADALKDVSVQKEYANIFIQKLLPDSSVGQTPVHQMIALDQINELYTAFENGNLSKSTAYQQLIPALYNKPNKRVMEVAKEMSLWIDREGLDYVSAVDQVMHDFPTKVIEYRSGKKGLIGFFMGQVKQKMGHGIDPIVLQKVIFEKLETL